MKIFIFFLVFFFIYSLKSLPINDTSILQEIVLVTENTIDESVQQHPYILMLYYDKRDEICKNFYYEFLKLRPHVKNIHPELKLGVYEMAPSLNTANILRIHKHPHIKLFIHGVENEHFAHHYKPFENYQEIFQWANSEIHRINPNPSNKYKIHQNLKITRLTKNANFSLILNSSNSKIIYCALEAHEVELEKIFHTEKYNISEILQKLKHAFSRDDVKFYIANMDLDLCQNNSGKLLIYGNHKKHPAEILHPKIISLREIGQIIRQKVNHHVFFSKNHDFLDKLWKTHKPLLLLFMNKAALFEDLIKNIETIFENPHVGKHLQFAIVDFHDSHGKTLFEKFRLSFEEIPSIMITHDISHKSKKFLKKIESDNYLEHIQSFIEKYFDNTLHKYRYHKSKRTVVSENHPFAQFKHFLHLHTEDFNQTVNTKSPMIVLFYYKQMNFERIMHMYEQILNHIKEEYSFNFGLATFDLYHNEIDNIGYYNIDRMPAVFLYLNSEFFIDLTNISMNHDIQNILYVLEKHMKDKIIKYHSAKKIRTSIKDTEKNHFNYDKKFINNLNFKNEL